jgi:uncharacterized membrane protein
MFFKAGNTAVISAGTKSSEGADAGVTPGHQYNSLMLALRYLYVLALVIWLGGMVLAGMVVAPAAFGVLEAWNPAEGRVLAGQVFGRVLDRLYLIAYVAGGLMFITLTVQRIMGPRPKAYGIRVGILAVMIGVNAYLATIISPRIDTLQLQVRGPMNRLAIDDPRRIEFERLHGLSAPLMGVAIVGGLALIGWETRE